MGKKVIRVRKSQPLTAPKVQMFPCGVCSHTPIWQTNGKAIRIVCENCERPTRWESTETGEARAIEVLSAYWNNVQKIYQ